MIELSAAEIRDRLSKARTQKSEIDESVRQTARSAIKFWKALLKAPAEESALHAVERSRQTVEELSKVALAYRLHATVVSELEARMNALKGKVDA